MKEEVFENEAKGFYEMISETGELTTVFSEYKFCGDWRYDREKFLKVYKENIEALEDAKNLNVDDFEEL